MNNYDRPTIIENYYRASTALMNIGTAENIPNELKDLAIKASAATVKIIEYINAQPKPEPKLIKTWKELAQCTSESHILEINLDYGHGWIIPKFPEYEYVLQGSHYLSTHTFFGINPEWSTRILQKCGFNVKLVNWDTGVE